MSNHNILIKKFNLKQILQIFDLEHFTLLEGFIVTQIMVQKYKFLPFLHYNIEMIMLDLMTHQSLWSLLYQTTVHTRKVTQVVSGGRLWHDHAEWTTYNNNNTFCVKKSVLGPLLTCPFQSVSMSVGQYLSQLEILIGYH